MRGIQTWESQEIAAGPDTLPLGSMRFVRTDDAQLIEKIVSHPRIWNAITDDNAPSSDTWNASVNPAIWHVLARENDELLGLFSFYPSNSICWRAHLCLLPNSWGSPARRAGKGVIRWLFENSPCLKITGEIPIFNTLALRYVRSLGFEEMGTNHDSFLKDGQLYDQILLGLSKGSLWA